MLRHAMPDGVESHWAAMVKKPVALAGFLWDAITCFTEI